MYSNEPDDPPALLQARKVVAERKHACVCALYQFRLYIAILYNDLFWKIVFMFGFIQCVYFFSDDSSTNWKMVERSTESVLIN